MGPSIWVNVENTPWRVGPACEHAPGDPTQNLQPVMSEVVCD